MPQRPAVPGRGWPRLSGLLQCLRVKLTIIGRACGMGLSDLELTLPPSLPCQVILAMFVCLCPACFYLCSRFPFKMVVKMVASQNERLSHAPGKVATHLPRLMLKQGKGRKLALAPEPLLPPDNFRMRQAVRIQAFEAHSGLWCSLWLWKSNEPDDPLAFLLAEDIDFWRERPFHW